MAASAPFGGPQPGAEALENVSGGSLDPPEPTSIVTMAVRHCTQARDERAARWQSQTLHEGSTCSDCTHHIAMHCSSQSLAQLGMPFRPAHTNATSRAPARRSTRKPCMTQLTRREIAQLPRTLGGRTFAPAMPSGDARRPPTKRVRLVHLAGRDMKSARRWCCACAIRMRTPARKHGALGGRASGCNGGARARRVLQ